MAVESKLPPIWEDDVRMNAMFSEFRSRDVNPVDFNNKMSFWSGVITDWLDETDRLTFSILDARKAFTRKGSTPRCLETVVLESVKQGYFLPLSEFLKCASNPGWMSWSVNLFVKRPLSYAWQVIQGAIMEPQLDQSFSYINILKLKEKAEAIIRKYNNADSEDIMENPIQLENLQKACSSICGSESDLELCLLWLQKEGSVRLHNADQHKVVTFLDGSLKSDIEHNKTEKAVIQLGFVKTKLQHQIKFHQSNIQKCTNEAREHLRSNRKAAAKVSLVKRKKIEKSLLEKETTLENIECLLEQLKDVHMKKSVIEAFQFGVDALNEKELSLDDVDDTMLDVTEALKMHTEIQNSIAMPVQDTYDLTSLQEELDAILSDANDATTHEGSKLVPTSMAEELSLEKKLQALSNVSDLPSPTKQPDFLSDPKKELVY